MKKVILPAALILLLGLLVAFKPDTGNNKFFEITKNLEIFTNMYKELNTYYVDDIDPDKIVKIGIDAMMESLDPYTVYIPEEDAASFRYQLTGKYGGVGVTVRKSTTDYILTEVYEGSPALRAGLRAGDVLLQIGDKKLSAKGNDDDTDGLKGAPGTEVSLKVRHANGKEEVLKVIREEIKIPNIPYAAILDDGIAYINVSTFTEKVGLNVENTLRQLQDKGEVKSIVLDLRGNGGGLLNEAVNLVNVFVPKKQLVVETKGKIVDWDRSFRTLNPPLETEKPMVVLIDGNSASASEITAGALQDLDRAVLVGERSFGKGLVQNTRDVGYNAKIKLTTAKYYTPSGRCIQAVEYTDGKAKNLPDSLRQKFKTKNGRTVYDGGGITPDVSVAYQDEANFLLKGLTEQYILFDFASKYQATHPTIASPKEFRITDADYEDFIKYVNSRKYAYETESEKALKLLEEETKKENTGAEVANELATLRKQFDTDKKNDLSRYKTYIKSIIEREIVSRYYYEKGQIEAALRDDEGIKTAIQILKDPARYNKILTGK